MSHHWLKAAPVAAGCVLVTSSRSVEREPVADAATDDEAEAPAGIVGALLPILERVQSEMRKQEERALLPGAVRSGA